MTLQELVDQKFTSGNHIPVERIAITRSEYEALTTKEKDSKDDQ